MTARLRLLVFNQYYWPGVEASARLLTQLCGELAADFDVTVVTGCLRGSAERHERIVHNGVEVIRVASTSFDRAPLVLRAVNYATYLASSLWAGVRVRRPDVVICMTDPPVLGNIALPVARRYGVPLMLITQDVFPEIAVSLKRLEQPILIESLRRAIGFSLKRADSVVAIGEMMRKRLEAKGAPPGRIAVIPNWADTDEIKPMPRDSDWALERDLARRFVVMHSGNVGYAQDLETLIRASTLVRDLDDLRVVVIGDGARRKALVELTVNIAADAVRFLPYQPLEVVSKSLSAADVHFVGLAKGLAGLAVPSRLYGIMASSRPVIVSAEAESDTARLVSEVGCGLVVEPGRMDLVAGVIRELHEGRHDLEEMGRRGYDFVRSDATRAIAAARYRALLLELAGRS